MKGIIYNGYIELVEYTDEDLENLFKIVDTKHIEGNKIQIGYVDLLNIEMEDRRVKPKLKEGQLPDYLYEGEKIALEKLLRRNMGYIRSEVSRVPWLISAIFEKLGRPVTMIINHRVTKHDKLIISKLTKDFSKIRYLFACEIGSAKFYEATRDTELLIITCPNTISFKYPSLMMDINAYYRYIVTKSYTKYKPFVGTNWARVSERKYKWDPFLIIFEIDNFGLKDFYVPKGGRHIKKIGLLGERALHTINCANYLLKYGRVLVIAVDYTHSAILYQLAKVKGIEAQLTENPKITILTYFDALKTDPNRFDVVLVPPLKTILLMLKQHQYSGYIGILVDKNLSYLYYKDRIALRDLTKNPWSIPVSIMEVNYNERIAREV